MKDKEKEKVYLIRVEDHYYASLRHPFNHKMNYYSHDLERWTPVNRSIPKKRMKYVEEIHISDLLLYGNLLQRIIKSGTRAFIFYQKYKEEGAFHNTHEEVGTVWLNNLGKIPEEVAHRGLKAGDVIYDKDYSTYLMIEETGELCIYEELKKR